MTANTWENLSPRSTVGKDTIFEVINKGKSLLKSVKGKLKCELRIDRRNKTSIEINED